MPPAGGVHRLAVHLLPGDAFAGVVGQGVGDLVAEDRRQPVVVALGHVEQAGEDRHLAAGQAEGVDLLVLKTDIFRSLKSQGRP